ncbi:MAG: DTW domain-containing protein [Pseudomonadota bacterium]
MAALRPLNLQYRLMHQCDAEKWPRLARRLMVESRLSHDCFPLMRSVVLKPTIRCLRCHMPPRWCICGAHQDIPCPLKITLLSHPRELIRPSSTGNLITRLFPDSRVYSWNSRQPPTVAEVAIPERELWILHPHGRPAPAEAVASGVQVVLLDGLWNETAAMAREVGRWGRLVSLPMTGTSRYWLRAKQDGNRFSTAEALMFLLSSLDCNAECESLRVQFELHVYASLRSRGRTDLAAEFLAGSIIGAALPEFLAQLHTQRPL